MKNKLKKALILILSLSGLSLVLAGCGVSVPGVSVNPNIKPTKKQSLASFTRQVAGNVKTYHFADKTVLVAQVKLHYTGTGGYKSGHYAPSKDFYRYCHMAGGTYKTNLKGYSRPTELNDFLAKVDRINESDVFNPATNKQLPYKVPSNNIWGVSDISHVFQSKPDYENKCVRNGHTLFEIVVNNYLTNSYIYWNGIVNANISAGKWYSFLSADILNVIY
jgi:hypothetical protein